VSFGDAELPGKSSVFYSGPAAGSRSAVVTGNGDVFRFALGHSNGHDAHADDGHQFDRDAGLRIGAFQVVNQFGQILDRVNVVMRRRRYQADSSHAVSRLSNVDRHFVAGQFATFVRIGQISRRHSESTTSNCMKNKLHLEKEFKKGAL
jgi:hypothetical protein